MKELFGDNIAFNTVNGGNARTTTISMALSAQSSQDEGHLLPPAMGLLLAGIYCHPLSRSVSSEHADIWKIILHLALRHGGSEWLEYDRTFHQQAAADPTIPWNILNTSLMASSVLSVTSAHSDTCAHTARN